ncbi:MAG: IS1182 family transposase [Verrucomicrobiia bacterium]
MQRPLPPRQDPLFVVPSPVPDTAKRRLLLALEPLLDFSAARAAAAPFFAERGRPAIPVERMLKAMLIGCLFGISSDRRLAEECADSRAFSEFLGLRADEPMFSHASFTHWRQRLGPEFFREFLHDIVRQCVAHGMPLSQARTVDATTIKAQASLDGPLVSLPREVEINQYLQDAFAADEPALPVADDNIPLNRHDPEARLQRKGKEPADFNYQGSFSADPQSGLIVDATATPTEQPQTMVDHVDHDPGVVRELVADRRYDEGTSLEQLQERQITPYVPRASRKRAGQISKDEFVYEPEQDRYRCPNGCYLNFFNVEAKRRRRRYAANQADCARCPLKAQCTQGRRRYVERHFSEAAREQTVREGPRYRQLMRARRIAEHLFMLGKRDHGLRRARSLGLAAVRIQVALTAAAINLKKLVRFSAWPTAAATALVIASGRLWQRLRALDTPSPRRGRPVHQMAPLKRGMPNPSSASQAF